MKRGGARNLIEFLLASSILVVAARLPVRWMPPLSRVLGRILDTVIRSRRRVVAQNVALAYGDDPNAPDPRALSRASLSSLCLSFLDLMHIERDPEEFDRRFRFATPEEHERFYSSVRDERPLLFAVTHFGAYELAGAWGPIFGGSSVSLVRPFDNELLDRFIAKRRQKHGSILAGNRGGMRIVGEQLKRGGIVAVMADLNMRGPKRVFVDFFGVPAATATTIPRLARRHGAIVLPVFCRRTDDPRVIDMRVGRAVLPDLEADEHEEDVRILQSVHDDLESQIRACPEQWLWTHRRWKTRPEGEEGRAP